MVACISKSNISHKKVWSKNLWTTTNLQYSVSSYLLKLLFSLIHLNKQSIWTFGNLSSLLNIRLKESLKFFIRSRNVWRILFSGNIDIWYGIEREIGRKAVVIRSRLQSRQTWCGPFSLTSWAGSSAAFAPVSQTLWDELLVQHLLTYCFLFPKISSSHSNLLRSLSLPCLLIFLPMIAFHSMHSITYLPHLPVMVPNVYHTPNTCRYPPDV